jgi:hypothetical protein
LNRVKTKQESCLTKYIIARKNISKSYGATFYNNEHVIIVKISKVLGCLILQ